MSDTGTPWLDGVAPPGAQHEAAGGAPDSVLWSNVQNKPETATEHPTFAQVRQKPITLAGYGITDAVATSDPRLSDARAPTAHGSTHAAGGPDAIPLGGYSLAQLGTRDASSLTGTLADAQLSANVPRLDGNPNAFTGLQRVTRGGAAQGMFGGRVTGDTVDRSTYAVSGERQFGTGAAARTLFERLNAGITQLWLNGTYAADNLAVAAGSSATDLGGGSGVLALRNATTVPASTPPAGALLYASAGGVKVLGAGLELAGAAGGLLHARMTTVQRDALSATPPPGLTIYNTTTSKLETYDGSTWQAHW